MVMMFVKSVLRGDRWICMIYILLCQLYCAFSVAGTLEFTFSVSGISVVWPACNQLFLYFFIKRAT